MGKHVCIALVTVWAGGCYFSHTRSDDDAAMPAADAATPAADAGPACEFSVRIWDGTEIRCAISAGSMEGCTEAAECICRAQESEESVEFLQCTGFELVPRGGPTFADTCTIDPPAGTMMGEALAAYFRTMSAELIVNDACRSVPALIGHRPYDGCSFLAEQLCPCGAEPCDLDAMLGRACLELTREQVACVNERIGGNSMCMLDVPAVVRECES